MSLYALGLLEAPRAVRKPLAVGAVETLAAAPKPAALYLLVGLALIYAGRTRFGWLPGI